MFFITSFNKRLWESYAHTFVNSYVNCNHNIPLVCYVEEDVPQQYDYPHQNKVKYLNLFKVMPELVEFKEKYKSHQEWQDDTDFLQNAHRFSYKVFAQAHASKEGKKFMWLDADNQFHNRITTKFFNDFIPDDTTLSYYGREGSYTECGVIGFNCTLDLSKKFFDIYLGHYTKGTIWQMKHKTDCHALDSTREQMKGISGYKEILKGDGRSGHTIARDKTINIYIDHKKGKRKFKRHSPEWEQHRR
jgi:hypothetical protein